MATMSFYLLGSNPNKPAPCGSVPHRTQLTLRAGATLGGFEPPQPRKARLPLSNISPLPCLSLHGAITPTFYSSLPPANLLRSNSRLRPKLDTHQTTHFRVCQPSAQVGGSIPCILLAYHLSNPPSSYRCATHHYNDPPRQASLAGLATCLSQSPLYPLK